MRKIAIFLYAIVFSAVTMMAQDISGTVTKDGMVFTSLGDGTASVKAESTTISGEVTIPETVEIDGQTCTVTTVANSGFTGCTEITDINLPSTLTTIGASAFYQCKFKNIELPEGLETIGDGAFTSLNGSGMTSIIIPASVKSIGYRAFYNLPLESIDIQGNADSPQLTIGEEAFSGTRKLIASIKVARPVPPVLGKNVFTTKEVSDATIVLYGDAALKLDEYKAAEGWKYLNLTVEIPSSLSSVVVDLPADAPVEIYSLNGIRQPASTLSQATALLSPGLYVVRTPSLTTKLIVN